MTNGSMLRPLVDGPGNSECRVCELFSNLVPERKKETTLREVKEISPPVLSQFTYMTNAEAVPIQRQPASDGDASFSKKKKH